jgi:HK97 family phage major capsid protein
VLNVTGTTSQAFATDLLTTLRQARTKVRVTGRATPTAYVMHPNDWEDLDLLQDNEARYYFGGPSVLGTPRLWGLPVVESEGMTEGTAMVADWRLLVLWDREAANILISDSHSDFFVRNMLAVLAEMRAALGCLRPSAFVEVDLTA